MQQNIQYLVFLSHIPEIGPKRIMQLWDFFKDPKEAFFAPYQELLKSGISPSVAKNIISSREKIDQKKILEEIEKEEIRIIAFHDQNYPELLKHIPCPPPFLYYRGNEPIKKERVLAIVGTRKCSKYGREVVEKFIPELARQKITVVSGLAFGIDTVAHQETIRNGGKTLAIIGSGLARNMLYPQGNLRLADEIIKSGGALYSEFPPQTKAQKHTFPQRNRIISGMAQATLVIEAGESSGALITASYALEQNREVLTVPGNIFNAKSIGTNALIQQGAKLVRSLDDILEVFHLTSSSSNGKPASRKNELYIPQNSEEEKIIQALSLEPVGIDELRQRTGFSTSQIQSTLSLLEIRGVVRNSGGVFTLI